MRVRAGNIGSVATMSRPFRIPRQVWFAVFGASLLLAIVWVAMNSGPLAPIKVTVTQAIKGDVAPSLFGIGTVEARRAYLIGPTVAGRVQRVLVDVGDRVSAGQLLAEMDPVDLDQRIAAAAASVERGRKAIASAQAQVSDARSKLALAVSEARRYVDLGKRAFVSHSVVDGKLQQQQSSEAQVAAAEAALASARQDVTRLEAELGAVKEQRGNIRLQAPVNGVVTLRDAEPGSTVVAGQVVLKLIDPQSVWVKTRIDQSRAVGLQAGMQAAITLRSRPHEALAGKAARIEPVSDSVTEERIASVAFDDLPAELSTGEMAEVTLRLPVIRDALLIPNAALRRRGIENGVWLRANGRLRFAPVRTGAQGPDGKMQVLDGLNAGDEIIVYSERDLDDDSRIKVVATLQDQPK